MADQIKTKPIPFKLMADPYWRYSTGVPPLSAERGSSIPKPTFPGHLSSDTSSLTTFVPYSSTELRGTSTYLQNDILPSRPEAYAIGGISTIRPEPGHVGFAVGVNSNGYPSSLGDPNLMGHRTPGIHTDVAHERPSSIRRLDGPHGSGAESNVLFVDGLPTDSTRREIGHLFRPFIGFRELRVVHKEPRRRGDKAMVLCFVEFSDAKCALTAMEALQGYKFDDRKPESSLLKIYFAHFPFRLPSDRADERVGVPR